MATPPQTGPSIRPRRAGRTVAGVLALVAAAICLVVGIASWSSAFVTYALPNAVGHDVLASRLAGGILAWLMAGVAALGAILAFLRSARWIWLAVGALVLALVVVLVVMAAPTPVY